LNDPHKTALSLAFKTAIVAADAGGERSYEGVPSAEAF